MSKSDTCFAEDLGADSRLKRGALSVLDDIMKERLPKAADVAMWKSGVYRARVAVQMLAEAAGERVAASFDQARAMADRGEAPVFCRNDVLNPCWLPGMPITNPLRHWGGGDACSHCRIRAALVLVEGGQR